MINNPYRAGDFVVSLTNVGKSSRLRGSILEVIQQEGDHIRYTGLNGTTLTSPDCDEFRLASLEEIEYQKKEKLTANIKNMKKEFDWSVPQKSYSPKHKFKKGDKVLVKRNPTEEEINIWKDAWTHECKLKVGKVLKVLEVNDKNSIRLEGDWWFPACILELEKEEKKSFPSHGWCPNPSKEVYKYVMENFNDGKKCGKGHKGIAWNNRSAWKIEGHSGYTEYDNINLEKLLPKKVVVDIESGGLFGGKSMFDASNYVFPVWRGAEKTGKTSGLAQMMHLYDPYEEEKRIRDFKQMEYDRLTASSMAMIAGHSHNFDWSNIKSKDEFTQQEAVVRKSNKKKRKLIIT